MLSPGTCRVVSDWMLFWLGMQIWCQDECGVKVTLWLACCVWGGQEELLMVQLPWEVHRCRQFANISHMLFSCWHYFIWLVCKCIWQTPVRMREWLFCVDSGHWCGVCPWQLILGPAQCLLRWLFSLLWLYFKVRFQWAFVFVGLRIFYLAWEYTVSFHSKVNFHLVHNLECAFHWWWILVHMDREDIPYRNEGSSGLGLMKY